MVTSYTEVWIEMTIEKIILKLQPGHLLYGGVD